MSVAAAVLLFVLGWCAVAVGTALGLGALIRRGRAGPPVRRSPGVGEGPTIARTPIWLTRRRTPCTSRTGLGSGTANGAERSP